ncbi:MAG: hypothetical protein JKY65_25995 [Planctomycetes bacterium]|nr:hypothetical protein [Planctomycetota bacterium]
MPNDPYTNGLRSHAQTVALLRLVAVTGAAPGVVDALLSAELDALHLRSLSHPAEVQSRQDLIDEISGLTGDDPRHLLRLLTATVVLHSVHGVDLDLDFDFGADE